MSATARQFAIGLAAGGVVVAIVIGVVKMSSDAPEPAPVEAAPAPVPTADETPKTGEPAPPLKTLPGVRYEPPKGVPEALLKKYSTFADALESAKESGDAKITEGSGAYQINHVDSESALSKVGLRAGDKVISINGQPIGKADGKAGYEGMKGEKRFSILVERDGKQIVISYTTE